MPQPSINTPSVLQLAVKATADRPAVQIKTMHDARSGRYINASIAVDHPMVPITPTLLTKLRLGTLRRDALRAALHEHNKELAARPVVKTYFKSGSGRPVSEKVRTAPTPEHLENAGLIYRLARLVGDYPVQAVARSFGLEPADSARWVNLARRVGVI